MALNKKIIFLFSALTLAFAIFFIKNKELSIKAPSSKEKKIQVVTSFYPLYFFAKEIGGDRVNVVNITPAGSEPHDYELTAKDLISIEKADIVFLNGGGLEAWAEKVKDNFEGNTSKFVMVAEDLITLTNTEDGQNIRDPHVWLDPVLAKLEAKKITNAFTQIDPEGVSLYKEGELRLEERLDELDTSFRNGLKSCTQKNIVTSHSAFGYIASRYGLVQTSISGLSPDEEPSLVQLSKVAQYVKDNAVKYIFFETLVSPKLSETIASEVGAKTLAFNPLEGLTPEDERGGKDYFTIQAENLSSLKTALGCSIP